MEKKTNHHEADPQEELVQQPLTDRDAPEENQEENKQPEQPELPVITEAESAPPEHSETSEEKAPVAQEEPKAQDEQEKGEELQRQGEEEPQRQNEEEEEKLNIPEILPILPLKDTVIYPFSVQPFAVGQERYIRLIDDVMHGNRLVVLAAQKSPDIDHAGPDDIYRVGTVSRIGRMFRMPDGTVQIAVQGLERVTIDEFTQEKPYLLARISTKPDTQERDTETEALKRNGAKRVFACATHGVLSGPAIQRINESPIEELVITNSIALSDNVRDCRKIRVLSIGRLLGEAIKRIHHGDSISSLFV